MAFHKKASSDEEEITMIGLWNEGLSAISIATTLNLKSRHVVIGRINRLINKGDMRITRECASRPINIASAPRIAQQEKPQKPAKVIPALAIEAPDNSKRISILDVGRNQCRFPVDDNDLSIYCGHPGYPYCTYHRAQCYTRVPGTSEDRARALAASRNSGSKRQFGG